MSRRIALALVASALCLAAGCAPLKPATPSMFVGNCMTPPGEDPCSSDISICQNFEAVIVEKYATSGACRTACNQVYNTLYYQGYNMRQCGYMLDRGNNLCEQECLRQYPKPQ